ncbi:sigma-54-dependent transcriptional regulator [Vulgatibacter sp.]|uniref:sigma-54-dependent transcriptional regulator n=1 Tax=Vulgatibacter sp. TaxID=1971226 RepID=UPI0035614E59
MPNARILIADDEAVSREALAEMLSRWGHVVTEASDGNEALKKAIEAPPDVIVSDLVMPTLNGLSLLRALREELPEVPVILLTGKATIDSAVSAIRQGAYDYLEKPVEGQRLRMAVERALEKKATLHMVAALQHNLRQSGGERGFIGQSAAMQQVFKLIDKVAGAKTSVVITGESGTGKEMVARSVHNASPRAEKPFIALNCSAIPATLMESEIFGHERGAFTGADQRRQGCFELADGGTLFLDEIGELPVELQAKLLRVLEEGTLRRIGGKSEIRVDCRVICATNRDLKQMIKEQQFREDLYFRLNVFHIELPSLKERREDIPLLVQHFVDRFRADSGKKVRGASPDALQALASYRWPGNIRELRNTIERAVILCDGELIEREHLPREIAGSVHAGSMLKVSVGMPLREVEKEYILFSLQENGGNKARTAEILQISEKTLYNKLNRYARNARDRIERDDAENDALLAEAAVIGNQAVALDRD